MHAQDLVQAGETALVIFTRGENFVRHRNGSGETGSWKINPNRTVHKVILYHRDSAANESTVYVALPVEIVETELAGRRVIRLGDIKAIGTTDKNWWEFTGTKRGAANPVKYISA